MSKSRMSDILWALFILKTKVHFCIFNDFIIYIFLVEPRVGPNSVSLSRANETTWNISWAPLPREKSYGKVIMYNVKEELLSRAKRRKRSSISSRTVNTTRTYFVLYDMQLCSRFRVSVRAYTKAGPGPYGNPFEFSISEY